MQPMLWVAASGMPSWAGSLTTMRPSARRQKTQRNSANFRRPDPGPSGLKHGTVGISTDIGLIEITTFRTEGTYSDARHPDWVAFVE